MKAKARAPWFVYLFVMLVGLPSLFFGGALSVFADAPHTFYDDSLLVVLAGFAVGQFVLGGACGLLWPRVSWRWAVWSYGVPTCIISFNGRGSWFLLGWLAMTVLPACAGVCTAAALHPRPVAPARN